MKIITFSLYVAVIMTQCSSVEEEHAANEAFVKAPTAVEAGRYIIKTSGCNDCHTDGFMQNPEIPESEWLTGSALGWRGPWGTTYPSNLRLSAQNMTEEEWILMLKTRKGMPPMPWPSVNSFSESDAKALYAYLKWLGAKGELAPLFVAPGIEPQTPYLSMLPQNLPAVAEMQ